MVMSLSRVLWKVRSKAPTVTASVQGTVSVTGEGYTTIRDSTLEALGDTAVGINFRLVIDSHGFDHAADDGAFGAWDDWLSWMASERA